MSRRTSASQHARHMTLASRIRCAIAMGMLAASTIGCQQTLYAPEEATRAYPDELHRPEAVDIQVFRDGQYIDIYNATATSYNDFDLWINQRYMRRVDALPAGGHVRLYLGEFWDELGEAPNAGGFWRVTDPTPVVLAEIQVDEEQLMIGLITIRQDDPRQQ